MENLRIRMMKEVLSFWGLESNLIRRILQIVADSLL
jgi:hypothetical protein